jgi:hypothetical protein
LKHGARDLLLLEVNCEKAGDRLGLEGSVLAALELVRHAGYRTRCQTYNYARLFSFKKVLKELSWESNDIEDLSQKGAVM